jgi:hypothetical protein
MANYAILPVNKIRRSINLINYYDSTARNMSGSSRLEKIIEARKHNRMNWNLEKRTNYEMFLKELKEANDNYVHALKNEIEKRTRNILTKDINAKSFTIWNPHTIECDLKGFKPFTIHRGFWNKDKRFHDILPHIEAGIIQLPIQQVNDDLLPLGYSISDISDRSKSFNLVISVNLLD